MTEEQTTSGGALGRLVTDGLGLIPHAGPLFCAVGLFGLEPRLRQLVALAVTRAGRCPLVLALHQWIGKAAGLTDHERGGATDGLTAAERSALALALATTGSPPGDGADPVDQHFTPTQIRQIRAVAMAVDFHCSLAGALTRTGA